MSTPQFSYDSRRIAWTLLYLAFVLAGATALFPGCPSAPGEEKTRPDGNTVWVDESPVKTTDAGEPTRDEVIPPAPVVFETLQVNRVARSLSEVVLTSTGMVVAGDGLYYSSDKGRTWQEVSPDPWEGRIHHLVPLTGSNKILAAGNNGKDGLLLLSEDGGQQWKVVKVIKSEGADEGFRSAVWVAPLIAIAAGPQGKLLRSIDGGNTWDTLDSLPDGEKQKSWNRIIKIGTDLILVGDQGTILQSQDNGAQWQNLQGSGAAPLFGVAFGDALHGVAVGAKGQLLVSRNSGNRWDSFKLDGVDSEVDIHTVASDGKGSYILLADRTYWVSKNRGGYWREYGVFITELSLKHKLTGAAFESAKVVYLTTTYGTVLKGTFR